MSETNGTSAGRRERRKFSATEKLRIVSAGLQADTKVSELCRREGISATQFYPWKDRLFGSAAKVFEDKGHGPSVQEARSTARCR
jgi:transposase